MLEKFIMARDINGYNGFGLKFTGIQWQGILNSGVDQSITIPESPDATYKNLILIFSFQPGSSVWVSKNESADIPSGNLDSCNSELNPTARQVSAGDEIHFNTNDSADEIGAILYCF
jgi:hypothetical protein